MPTGALEDSNIGSRPPYLYLGWQPDFAGKEGSHIQPSACVAVRPRVCGERGVKTVVVRNGYGSSPRVRRTPAAAKLVAQVHRFIPASAGNATTPKQ